MKRCHPLLAGLLFFCLSLSAAPARYELTVNTDQQPIIIKKKLMLVKARVNGQEGLFLLDTGVSRLTLNARIFGEGSRESSVRMLDITGVSRPFREKFIDEFAWGALQRERFLVYLVEMEQLEGILETEILGLIGYEVIKDLEMRIDYGARHLTLYRLDGTGAPLDDGAAAPDHRMPFQMRGHLPSIEVNIGPHESLQLGVDSGSALNVLNKNWIEQLKDQALGRYKIRYNAVLSSRRVDFFTLPRIDIAEELALIYSKFAFANLTHLWEHSVAVDGLLGIELFRLGEVAINYKQRQISLWVHDNVYAMKYRPLKVGP
jgi:hypothetical protein